MEFSQNKYNMLFLAIISFILFVAIFKWIDYLTNEDDLISFLNEYYIVYPKKLPKQQFK
jgi:hypothetical protein